MTTKNTDITAVEIIVETLKQCIQKGTLKPGDKLPTLRQMETTYGVSRIVVREAIKVLEGKGLLYSKQGSGIYVTSQPVCDGKKSSKKKEYTGEEMFSLFEFIFNYAVFEIKNLKNMKEIVEWKKMNDELIENYRDIDMHKKFAYESTFGAKLVGLSGNKLAYDFYMMLVKPWGDVNFTMVSDSEYLEILKIDRNFLDALLKREPHRACLWGHERNAKTLNMLKDKDSFLKKKYQVFE